MRLWLAVGVVGAVRQHPTQARREMAAFVRNQRHLLDNVRNVFDVEDHGRQSKPFGSVLRDGISSILQVSGGSAPPLYGHPPVNRPQNDRARWSDVLTVRYTGHLTSIREVNFQKGRVDVLIREDLEWYDPRLSFEVDHDEWDDDARCLTLPVDEFGDSPIWLPELHAANHAFEAYHETHTSIFPACVYSEVYASRTGANVKWSKLTARVFTCVLMFDSFPFDSHVSRGDREHRFASCK